MKEKKMNKTIRSMIMATTALVSLAAGAMNPDEVLGQLNNPDPQTRLQAAWTVLEDPAGFQDQQIQLQAAQTVLQNPDASMLLMDVHATGLGIGLETCMQASRVFLEKVDSSGFYAEDSCCPIKASQFVLLEGVNFADITGLQAKAAEVLVREGQYSPSEIKPELLTQAARIAVNVPESPMQLQAAHMILAGPDVAGFLRDPQEEYAGNYGHNLETCVQAGRIFLEKASSPEFQYSASRLITPGMLTIAAQIVVKFATDGGQLREMAQRILDSQS
jgi:hypothetical protein